MNAMQLLTGPVSQAIGWAILHLLWQATIVAGILAAVLALVPRRAATARYAAACSALVLVFAMFVATAVRSYDPLAVPIAAPPHALSGSAETMTVALSEVPKILAATAAATWRDRTLSLVATARQSLPSVVGLWLAGVILLSSRLLVSWLRAQRLVRRNTQQASAQWERAAARISEALGLRRAVRLLESAAVEVPSVLGTLRPVILLPASTLTGLTPDQIEMVLAHELAHIRRHDFLVNLLQAFVETLMFYHPAVWWMSRSVRIERENCCDDLAVAVCGNPIQYARALTRLEELRAGAMPVVVAANGGSLIDRIRRIATGRAESTSASARWAAAVVMLIVLGAAMALPSLPALAQRDDEPKKAEKAKEAKEAKSHVDVVEASEPAKSAEPTVEADWSSDDLDEEMADPDDEELIAPEVPPVPIVTPYPPVAPRAPYAVAPMAIATPAPMAMPAPVAVPAAPAPPTPMPYMRPARAPRAQLAWLDRDVQLESEDADDENDNDEKDFGASGKLTVDELIQLRAVGVTPAYIAQMRSVFPEVSLRGITQLRAVGVSPEFIKEMRAAGFEIKSARDAQSLSAVGVTGEWLRAMKAAGIDIKTAHDATQLRAVGVSPELVKQLAAAGYANLSIRELTSMAAVGIDGDFIREMEKYRDKK